MDMQAGGETMYKVLLADDEILIRENIKKRIPWRDLGFELAASCENGKEAIECLKKENVDLVLTDICMPYVDGLEIARYVKEHMANAKVVIITGYDEFEYAREALEHHVFSYILKPITADELMETLRQVHGELDSERKNLKAHSLYENSVPVLRNQFLNQLVRGEIQSSELASKLAEFHIDFPLSYNSVVILLPRDSSRRNELYKAVEIMEAEYETKVLPFEGNDGTLIMLLHQGREEKQRGAVRLRCRKLLDTIGQGTGMVFSCLIGPVAAQPFLLSDSYEKARGLAEFIYLERSDFVYDWEEYDQQYFHPQWNLKKENLEERLIYAVQSNLVDDIRQDIGSIRREYRDQWIGKTKIVMIYQNLMLAQMNRFEKFNMEDQEFFEKYQEIISGLYNYKYISDMEKAVLEFFLAAAELMNKKRSSYGEQQVKIALEYINTHYGDFELSLQKLCKNLAISVSYFSAIFKNYTGMTFIEALNKRRIEKAIELLENTSLKHYEIAEKCGYSDASYFGYTFKKLVGKSPRGYVKELRNS